MTCKECICFKMCRMTDDLFFTDEIANSCDSFKDKSRFIELPCAFGDTAYQCVFFKDGHGFIIEQKVVGFHTGELPKLRGHKRKEYLIIFHKTTNSISHLDYEQIGITVFFTRAEAEKALAERSGKE